MASPSAPESSKPTDRTGTVRHQHAHTFPPSPSRWDDNWPATLPTHHTRFHRARLGGTTTGQLHAAHTTRFHRARLGGTTTGQLPPAHTARFHRARLGGTTTGQLPPHTPHVSTEPVSVGRQLASYLPAPHRFHRARLGGTTTGQLPCGPQKFESQNSVFGRQIAPGS